MVKQIWMAMNGRAKLSRNGMATVTRVESTLYNRYYHNWMYTACTYISLSSCMYKLIHTHIYIRAYDNGQSPDIYFPAKLIVCPAKSNLARQIFYTLSIKILWSLQKKMNVQTILNPYHKRWYVHTYIHTNINPWGSRTTYILDKDYKS